MAPLGHIPSAPQVGSLHGRSYGWGRRCPPPHAISCFRLQAWLTRFDIGTNEVRAGYRTRTVHDTAHGNYPLPCPFFLNSEAPTVRHTCPSPPPPAPSPALCARTVQSNVQSLPCPSRPSPSLLQLSGLLTSPVCPTSLALPVPSSLVPACPLCMTLRRHAAHCTFGGGLPCGSTPGRSALSTAAARCGRPARLCGTFLFLLLSSLSSRRGI